MRAVHHVLQIERPGRQRSPAVRNGRRFQLLSRSGLRERLSHGRPPTGLRPSAGGAGWGEPSSRGQALRFFAERRLTDGRRRFDDLACSARVVRCDFVPASADDLCARRMGRSDWIAPCRATTRRGRPAHAERRWRPDALRLDCRCGDSGSRALHSTRGSSSVSSASWGSSVSDRRRGDCRAIAVPRRVQRSVGRGHPAFRAGCSLGSCETSQFIREVGGPISASRSPTTGSG